MNTLLRLQLQKILKITPAQIDNLLTDNTVPDTGWANLTPEKLMELLRDVNQHYSHSDQEKLRLHRALEISTHESDILNESLRETNARLNHTLEELARMIREYRVHSRSAGTPDDRILLDSLGEILDENRALQREIETRRALLNILQDLETANREMDEKNRLLAKEIADRTRIEEALRENMEKYRKLFDEAQDAIIIADAETGEILSCNNATARLFGYEKEELIGRSQRVLHPFFDSSSLITKTFQQHLDEAEGQVLETQAITRNGEILEVAIKANLLDWHGRKVLQGIFHDITDQKRAQEELVRQNTELCAANEQLAATEAELKHKLEEIVSTHSTLSISMQALTESEEKYRQLADSISDVFFAMDNNLVYTYWNKASEQLMGVSAQDVIGKSHSDLFPEKGDLMAERHYQDAIQKQQPMSFVDSYRRGDSEYTLEINEYPTSRGISVFAKDITEHKLAEEAIRESEQRYRNVVEDQTEFISRFLPDGTHIFVNDAYCRYYGVAREQILGHRFRPVLYADDREAVTGFFATLTLKNPVGTIEHRIVMPDGNIRWQRWSDRAIFDDKGDVVEYQSVGQDITGQKEVEEAIKRSKTQLTAIIQGSPIPKFVIDKDHHVIHWNKALEGYSGILEKEIIGTNQHWRAFYKEVRPCMADLLLDGAVEKIPGWYAGKYAKSKLIDGAYEATDFFPHMGKAGVWLFFTASVITDDEGNILGAVETLEDITETHLKTEELKAAYQKMQTVFDQAKLSEERYRNIVEDQTEFICRFLPNGTHIFVNDTYCRYFGISREEILGTRFQPTIHPDDSKNVARLIASLTSDNPHETIDQRIIMPDGSTRWQRWVYRAFFQSDGSLKEYQSVGRDITEHKRVEEELRESEEKYRDIFENSVMGLFKTAPDGSLIDANDAFARMHGYSGAAEIINAHLDVSRHLYANSEDRKEMLNIIAEKGKAENYETLHLKQDGTRFWASITARTIREADGTVLFYEGSIIDITDRKQNENQTALMSNLKETLLGTHSLKEQLELVSESCVTIFDADFARIWLIKGADLCEKGCRHASITVGPEVCRNRSQCLHLMVSSGRYTHIDGGHRRVPFGCYKIGRVASGEDPFFITNDVVHDPRVHDHAWAQTLGLVSFAGFRLLSADHTPVGVLALFKKQAIPPREEKLLVDLANTLSQVIISGIAEEALHSKNDELKAANEQISAADEKLRTNLEELTRQELVLRESEERFRMLLQHVPSIAIQGYNLDGTTQYWNEASERLYGYTAQEAIGKNLIDLIIPPEMQEDVKKTMNYMKETGQPIPASELSLMRKDGSRVEVFSHHAIVKHSKNKIELFCIDIDLSERKRAEQALQESEEFNRNLVDNLPDYLMIYNQQGRILFTNWNFTEKFGFTTEEVIGTSAIEHVAPEYHSQVSTLMKQRMADAIIPPYEILILKKDGSKVPVIVKGILIRYQNQNVVLLLMNDISDHKRIEIALRESEERYRNVIEDQTELICRFLPDGTHIFVNDAYCRYFDKKREEFIGHRFKPVLHPEDWEMVARHIASISQEHPVIDIDQRIIMPDGSTRWQRWSDRAIFDPDGRVVEYQSVGRDITEQKELEEEMKYHEQELMKFSTSLDAANKKLTLLSSITRHDINNQLTVLQGYLEILEDSQIDPSQSEYFQKVSTAAKRISAMIRFTKEYEEIGVHAPAWQDTRTLVDTAAKEAPLGKIIVKNDLPARAEVFADPLIVKVCYNLMDNAVRYGGKITTIRFSALKSGDDHLIVCEDDGDGIVAKEKERIFKRGFGKNTGLGLALSREILSITGITITETGEPGKGARFEIVVPKGMWRMNPDTDDVHGRKP